jgi:hypothetical protein
MNRASHHDAQMKGSYAVSTIPEDPIISNQSRKKFSLVMYHQKQTFNAPETKDSTNYLFKEQMVYVREIKLTKRRSAANAPQSPNKRMKIDKTEVAVDVQADAKISQDL